MKYLAIIILIFIASITSAQFSFIKHWDKSFGSPGWDDFHVLKTESGNFVIAGNTFVDSGGDLSEKKRGFEDFWIVKCDSFGNKIWDKRFGGSNTNGLHSLCLNDESYFFAGISSSSISGDKSESSKGGYDIWLVKTDKNGNKIWDKTFGGGNNENVWDIHQTFDRGFVLAGGSNSFAGGDKSEDVWGGAFNDDGWVVKIDSLGAKQWDRRYGGTGQDEFFAIVPTVDGGYLVGGYSSSNADGNKSQNTLGEGSDFWVVKMDSVGNKEWDRRYGTIDANDYLTTIVKTSDGNYLLAGTSDGGMNGDKTYLKGPFWILKIDDQGNKKWNRAYGGGDELYSAVATKDNGFLLSGRGLPFSAFLDLNLIDKSEDNLGELQTWIIKIDSMGNKQWDKTIFTRKSNFGSAIETSDGCYAVATKCNADTGGYKTEFNRDATGQTYDYWIIKFCMEQFNEVSDLSEQERKVLVYPNPFSSDISIAIKKEGIGEATFTITNSIGEVVYHRKETNLGYGYTKNLDLTPLPNGVYFIEVERNGEKVVRQVVKQ